MKTCPNPECLATNPDTAKFCSQCATKLDDGLLTCPACQTSGFDPSAKFCTECGSNLRNANPVASPPRSLPLLKKTHYQSRPATQLSAQDLIDEYIEENGHVFDFIIDDEGQIRIERYYDHPHRTEVIIPDFVYGFSSRYDNEDEEEEETPVFPNLEYVKNIILGKGVRDLSYIFAHSGGLSIDISHWDVSKVTNMHRMFYISELKTIGDLSQWDVSSVTDMRGMFSVSQLNNVGDLSQWDVSAVTDMSCMFFCSELKNVGDLSQWDVSNVIDMCLLFSDSELKNVGDLSQWNVSNVTDMGSMFSCSELKNVGDLSQWNVSNVTDMGGMFSGSELEDVYIENGDSIGYTQSIIPDNSNTLSKPPRYTAFGTRLN